MTPERPATNENRAGGKYNLSVCMLASGSKGNAIYISDGNTSILVDAGLSGREIERRMRSKGLSPENLDGIVVSHEHSDHIQGVGVLSRRYHLAVYMSRGTEAASASQMGNVHDLIYFNCGSSFQLNTLNIHPFSISHDAEDPAGFTINSNGRKIGIATDLGIATSMVREHLRECYVLIIEANHDADMLVDGPYPWFLKQRIKGRTGHLSNEDSNSLLKTVRHDGLHYVILAHLSEINNKPEIAQRVVGKAIASSNIKLTVASQGQCGEIIHI